MRLIDADKFEAFYTKTPEWVADDSFRAYVDGMTRILEEIDAAPTVDAVPVVRCRECRHYDTAGCCEGFGWCYRNGAGHGTSEDWYCADGEQKEEK